MNSVQSRLCFLVLCSSIFLSSITPAAAQKSRLDGTYMLDEVNSDQIGAAIEKAVGQLNFLTRPFARARLKKLNPAYREVTIGSSSNELSITVDSEPALRAPANGTSVVWTAPDGGKVNVSMRLAGGHLLQTFKSADGGRVNDYALSADGTTLTMQVTEMSARLSKPIRYKQVYKRVP